MSIKVFIMFHHTLILTTTKTEIPKELTIDFVTHLINRGLAMVEYFGIEIDNQHDYVDEEMEAVSNTMTYIEIFFDTEEPINYDTLNETEIDNLILNTLKSSIKCNTHSDGKDVTFHLHHN